MLGGGEAARPPERWLRAQQTFLGASLLLADRAAHDASALRETLEGKVWKHAYLAEESIDDYRAALRCMPTPTLHVLNLLGDEISVESSWRDHVLHWRQALEYQVGPATGERRTLSRVAAAKLLAERMLDGAVTSAQLVRLARAELGVDWSARNFEVPMDELLAGLRGTDLLKAGRLAALQRFSDQVGGRLPHDWALVENVIIEQSLAWPSLILASSQGVRHHREWDLPLEIRSLWAAPRAHD